MENEFSKIPPLDATYFQQNLTKPVRILVSTLTHLIPGDGFTSRKKFILNLISQHHWGDDYQHDWDHAIPYNCKFGLDGRVCHIILDHENRQKNDESAVPLLWYQWTGKELVPNYELLANEIQEELQKVPFTRPPQGLPPRVLSRLERRKWVLRDLRYERKPHR